MFFFFPLAENLATALAPQRLLQPQTLPMLPIPAARREERSTGNPFGDSVSYAGNFGVDVIRQIIASFTSSLTALGSRSSAFFSQIALALAFDRMARQAAALAAMGLAACGLQAPQPAFSGLWPMSTLAAMPFIPFAFPSVAMNPLAQNPWPALTDAFNAWTGFWVPVQPYVPSTVAPKEKAPFTAAFVMPGFSWGFAIG